MAPIRNDLKFSTFGIPLCFALALVPAFQLFLCAASSVARARAEVAASTVEECLEIRPIDRALGCECVQQQRAVSGVVDSTKGVTRFLELGLFRGGR